MRAGRSILLPDSLNSGNRAGFHWDYANPPGVDTIRVFATTERHLAERIRQTLKSSRNDGPGTSIFGQPVTKLASLRRELFGSITRGLITVPDQPGSNPNHLSIQSPGKVAEQAKQGLPPTQLTGMDLRIPDWTAVSVTVLVSQ